MNNDLHFTTGENDVATPETFFMEQGNKAVQLTGSRFIWDVAAVQGNRKCENYYGPDHINPLWRDCLVIDWPLGGPLWMNPPYGKPENVCHPTKCKKKTCVKRGFHCTEYVPGCYDFVEKAFHQTIRGCDIWMLLAARTDTEWWHDFVWSEKFETWYPHVSHVEFIKGRLTFEGREDPAPFPSVVVRFKL